MHSLQENRSTDIIDNYAKKNLMERYTASVSVKEKSFFKKRQKLEINLTKKKNDLTRESSLKKHLAHKKILKFNKDCQKKYIVRYANFEFPC